jgi:Arc/MetJ-type ribon-helix-helix transcriptional regulator
MNHPVSVDGMYCMQYDLPMAFRRRVATVRLDRDVVEAMEQLRERDGMQFSEQIRRALRLWLPSRGMSLSKADRKRVDPRKRS